MAKAVLNGVVIAESADTPVVDGYRYFPVETVRMELFTPTAHTSVCPWKGIASYFDIEAGGKVAHNAAWSYKLPKSKAEHIKGLIGFWSPVEIKP